MIDIWDFFPKSAVSARVSAAVRVKSRLGNCEGKACIQPPRKPVFPQTRMKSIDVIKNM